MFVLLIDAQFIKKVTAIYGPQMFITAFTKAQLYLIIKESEVKLLRYTMKAPGVSEVIAPSHS
jgi:hypothetical protein